MTSQEVITFIKFIPSIFIYLVPGYIFLYVSYFILSKKIENNKLLICKSLLLSYIILNISKVFVMPFKLRTDSPIFILICILFSIISGFLCAKFIRSKFFKNILSKASIDTTYSIDVWDDITKECDKGEWFWLTVYIQEENIFYQGILRKCTEQKDFKDSYIFLSNYSSYTYEGKKIDNFSNDSSNWVAIKENVISRIEIEYDKEH